MYAALSYMSGDPPGATRSGLLEAGRRPLGGGPSPGPAGPAVPETSRSL